MKKFLVFGLACLLLIVAFFFGSFFYRGKQAEKYGFLAKENASLFVRDHSRTYGSNDAKVYLIEFMDPACETCAKFHPFVKRLMDSHPGKVNLVVRYAAFHEGSDLMIKILEAVKKQGKFWEVLEKMFQTQPYWASHHDPQPQAFWNYLKNTGYDMAFIEEQIKSPDVIKALETDQADIKRLGVSKTPTFFVNGKPLPSFGYEQLVTLVNTEVAANY